VKNDIKKKDLFFSKGSEKRHKKKRLDFFKKGVKNDIKKKDLIFSKNVI